MWRQILAKSRDRGRKKAGDLPGHFSDTPRQDSYLCPNCFTRWVSGRGKTCGIDPEKSAQKHQITLAQSDQCPTQNLKAKY